MLDRCVLVAKTKRRYQDAYPETTPGGNRVGLTGNRQPRFSTYCAKVMGKSEKAVYLDAAIGSGLSQASYIMLKDTPAANVQDILYDLSKLAGTEQLAVAYMIANEGASNVAVALDMASKAASSVDSLV